MSNEKPADKPNNEDENAILEAMFAADDPHSTVPDNLPQLYANSFTVHLGTGDMLIVMRRNGQQIGTLQVSYTVGKSLAEVISGLIKHLEERTGNEIMTSRFIEGKMKEGDGNAAS